MPAEQVGGTQHVIAICPPDVNTSKVAEDRDSVILRLKTKEEVSLSFVETRALNKLGHARFHCNCYIF